MKEIPTLYSVNDIKNTNSTAEVLRKNTRKKQLTLKDIQKDLYDMYDMVSRKRSNIAEKLQLKVSIANAIIENTKVDCKIRLHVNNNELTRNAVYGVFPETRGRKALGEQTCE